VALALLASAQEVSVAQQERDAYRDAYQDWRQADPNLERDAAGGGAALGARADKVAAEAAKYFAARKTYLEAQRTAAELKASAIEAVVTAEFGTLPVNYAATQATSISASITAIAAEPDRLIQRLRQSLEQERNALTALNIALNDSQKGLEAIKRSSVAAEQMRVKIAERFKTLAEDLQQGALQIGEAGNSWASYYRALSEASRGAIARGPLLSTVIGPVRAPSNAPAAGAVETSSPAPAVRPPPATALPLYRYTGEWNYPAVGALFHGPQPQSVDMAVREESGQAKGTIVVRFQVPPGGVIDPSLRFTFEGPFQPSRNQSFPLVTGTGVKGTVELTPTSVFNMLQVAYQIETNPPRQGDFLVVKK
jgi:hypothetical protein